jgi:putative component of membrane protein insertase Oxa1/YidC/SpoIIIJ protein YidD
MMLFNYWFFILISILSIFYSSLYSQETNEDVGPWENEDIRQITFSDSAFAKNQHEVWPLYLIQFYQKKIAPQSISRCPFYISCSNYTTLAIKTNGLLIGMCMFIDRNLYRENFAAQNNYLLRDKNGELKYDDSFFINGY